jgi:hypothetical protein
MIAKVLVNCGSGGGYRGNNDDLDGDGRDKGMKPQFYQNFWWCK